MLNWDETDVLTVLEVIPEREVDGIWYRYVVEKDGIQLVLTVNQYDGDIKFELTNIANGSILFSMQLIDCSGVQRIDNQSGEYLEFAPSRCFGSRYSDWKSIEFGVRVSIKPSISISIFG